MARPIWPLDWVSRQYLAATLACPTVRFEIITAKVANCSALAYTSKSEITNDRAYGVAQCRSI